MPIFLNEYEIDDLVRRLNSIETPNLAAGAIILSNLRFWTNGNSDGWPYWRLPTNAAQKLMALLSASDRFNPVDCTEADLRRALSPIKAFLTKRGVDHGEVFPSASESEPLPERDSDGLTEAQRAVVNHYQGYNVPATWFYGEPRDDGSVEVIAIGDGIIGDSGLGGESNNFAWSFLIEANGEHSSNEATLGPFETGITV